MTTVRASGKSSRRPFVSRQTVEPLVGNIARYAGLGFSSGDSFSSLRIRTPAPTTIKRCWLDRTPSSAEELSVLFAISSCLVFSSQGSGDLGIVSSNHVFFVSEFEVDS